MTTIRIPPELADGAGEDDRRERGAWLAGLPATVSELARDWGLELGEPYEPGGRSAWVAPARDRGGQALVLKVGWRHPEAEHEAAGLVHWDGAGAVRCLAARTLEATSALLLERCVPGIALWDSTAEPEQDSVIAGLLRRLWEKPLPQRHRFGSLQAMCAQWADQFELEYEAERCGVDPGLARAGIALLRELPATGAGDVLLCTDLHAGNVLAARRERWLVIDPKPLVGDPAFDAVQHMLNCRERLDEDPSGLAMRLARLLEVDSERVCQWLFARCVQESRHDRALRRVARRLVASLP
jgi:streptomycin 6-kinase